GGWREEAERGRGARGWDSSRQLEECGGKRVAATGDDARVVEQLRKAVALNRIGVRNTAAGVEDDVGIEGVWIGEEKREDGYRRRGDQGEQADGELTAIVPVAPSQHQDDQQQRHGRPGERP